MILLPDTGVKDSININFILFQTLKLHHPLYKDGFKYSKC